MVANDQRHKRNHRCPICDGADEDPRGQGKRCMGFSSTDGDWVHCSREDFAGSLVSNNQGLFVHKMHGDCNCGVSHGPARESREIIKTYDYLDEHRQLRFQVVRMLGKQFRQRRPDGQGGWIWRTADIPMSLYRLPEILEADRQAPVLICEGEKDVDTALGLGFVATCNPRGAGKWGAVADQARKVLAGRSVVIFSDADDVGRKHAQDVASSLRDVVRECRTIEAPAPHKDLSDWISLGEASAADVLRLCGSAPLAKVEPIAVGAAPPVTAIGLAKGWTWRTADEIFFGPAKAARWIVKALGIAPGRPGVLSGPSGSAKTILAQSLILSLATGRPIWDHFENGSERPLVCAHVDCDLGLDDVEYRYRRVHVGFPGAQILPEDIGSRIRLVSFPEPALDLMSSNARTRLRGELAGVDFCVIDALRGVARGDENSSEYRLALDTLSAVSTDLGVAFLVLHHVGNVRLNQHGKVIEDDDADDRAGRGSSAIKDASGVVLRITGAHGRRKLVMKKPPGRTGVEWHGKFDMRIQNVDDSGFDDVEGVHHVGLRVVVCPESKRTKEEIADLAAHEAQKRLAQVEQCAIAVVRQAGTPGFKGGVDRLYATVRDSLRTLSVSAPRNEDGRALIEGLIEDKKLFRTGAGKASLISLFPIQVELTT